MDNFALIIGYRRSSEDRQNALSFVLNWWKNNFPEASVYLVEQDKKPMFNAANYPDIHYHFLYNPELYNRSWAFNYIASICTEDILSFSDADVFFEKSDVERWWHILNNGQYEVLSPNNYSCQNVKLDGSEFIRTNVRVISTFASLFFLIKREAFQKIGGWDERFEGWGGEDDAISHVIHHKLIYYIDQAVIYHIDHNRTALDGEDQPKYANNKYLSKLILSYTDTSLDRYISKLRKESTGSGDKYNISVNTDKDSSKIHFVIAISTYNRVLFLKDMLETWYKTKASEVQWTVVIADDGSTDETIKYLDTWVQRFSNEYNINLIQNKRMGVAFQKNSLLSYLSNLNFNFAFICDDDILFNSEGWDLKYYQISKESLYDHLIYYDSEWDSKLNRSPVHIGKLVNRCAPAFVQGAFFTITPKVIETVGYFDVNTFGFIGREHTDYSLRCCRAGFNSVVTPFDIADSNQYIKLNNDSKLNKSIDTTVIERLNNEQTVQNKKNIIFSNRIYYPYNYINNDINFYKTKFNIDDSVIESEGKANPTFSTKRGLYGILGFMIKKLYNLFDALKLGFMKRAIIKFGVLLKKIGDDLTNIEY